MHREVLISALTSQWSYKKYILIFKVNGKILRASEYTIAQLKKDLTIILSNCEKRYGVSLSEHDMKVIKTQLKDVSSLGFKYNKYSRVTSQYNHPIAFQGFMKIVSYLSQLIDHNESFTQLELIKECGYDAIYDDTGHRLTHDIAAQIAVLEEKAIQPLVKFENPNNLENMLRRQEERDRRTN
jgi:hypothetical protein